MRLYVDDDLASALLARLLAHAGHDVQVPASVGLAGEPDPVHLTHAVRDQRVFLSGNYRDFERLHDLILAAGGHHPGILLVRFDNDPTRDLSPRGIVRALANLIASGVPLGDGFHILNHWR